MTFVFDPTLYVPSGQEQSPGTYDAKKRLQIATLRNVYPELMDWGNLAIAMAWGDYSKAVLLTSWSDASLNVRDENFLNFLYWQQTRGLWGPGDEIKQLAQANEWRDT